MNPRPGLNFAVNSFGRLEWRSGTRANVTKGNVAEDKSRLRGDWHVKDTADWSFSYLIRRLPRWAWSTVPRNRAAALGSDRRASAALWWLRAPAPAPDRVCKRNGQARRWTDYRRCRGRPSRTRRPAKAAKRSCTCLTGLVTKRVNGVRTKAVARDRKASSSENFVIEHWCRARKIENIYTYIWKYYYIVQWERYIPALYVLRR